jgi:hypothetical protein
MMHLRRCSAAKCLMGALMVIEVEVVRNPVLELCDALVVVEIDVLILHATPESLNEHVV